MKDFFDKRKNIIISIAIAILVIILGVIVGISIHNKQIEKNSNLNHYEILQRYMFERILERISLLLSFYDDSFEIF